MTPVSPAKAPPERPREDARDAAAPDDALSAGSGRLARDGSVLPFAGAAALFVLVALALHLAGQLKGNLENEIAARLRICASLASSSVTPPVADIPADRRDSEILGRLEDVRRETGVSEIALYDAEGTLVGSTARADVTPGIPRRIRLGAATSRPDPSARGVEHDAGGGLTLVVPLAEAQGGGALIARVDRDGQGSLPAVDFLFNLAKVLAGVVTAAGLLILLRWLAAGDELVSRKPPPPASDVDLVLGTMKEVMSTLKDSETHYRDRSREAEAVAEHARRTNALILESISSALVAFDEAGRVTLCNPAAERILGLNGRAVRGRRVDDVLAPDDPLRRIAWTIRERGRDTGREELERDAAADEPRWLGVSGSVLHDADGEFRGGILLVDDLTETKRLRDTMRLKERLSAVGEMSSGIAHEIKNSLHSLLGYANLLKADATGEPPLPVKGILEEVRSLENLVKGILEFARPSRITRTPVDLNRLAQETVEATAAAAKGRGIEVRVDLDPALPLVAADGESVKRVFLNCALNAIEAMDAGGLLTITTRPAEIGLTDPAAPPSSGRAVRVAFRDTGPGIPEPDRAKIFTPFFTTKRDGHGLGLALVHKTVTDHGGRVQLHSRDQVGTEFVIVLPVEERS